MRKTDQEKTLLYTQRVAGIEKHLGKLSSMILDGVAYTPAAVAAFYTGWLDRERAVLEARNAWLVAVRKRDAAEAVLLPIDAAFKRFVLTQYGPRSAVIGEYGVAAPRTGKKTVDVKAAAAEKARATRTARGTMGKKQRKAVKTAAA